MRALGRTSPPLPGSSGATRPCTSATAGGSVTQYVGVLFSLAVFYYISRLVRVGPFPSPGSYFAYAAVGVIILQVLQSTLDMPAAVRQELVAGTFERMAVSPFGPVASILSLFLFPFASAVVTMLVTLALAALVFGLDPTLGARAAGDSRRRGGRPRPRRHRAAVRRHGRPLQAGAGRRLRAGGDLARGRVLLPGRRCSRGGSGWASDVQPFTPAVDLLRHLLVGQPLHGSAWADVAKLVGFSAVLAAARASPAVVIAIERSRRLGTLTEY